MLGAASVDILVYTVMYMITWIKHFVS